MVSFFLGVMLFFTACHELPPPENRLLEQKMYPADQFFIQRAYPDKTFPVKAYLKGLDKALLTQQAEGNSLFDGSWTTQGPGNLGSRINTIAAVPNSQTIYVGFSSGGVWKTTNNGQSWIPIFDDQTLLTVGDIVVDPNDTSTIYVGTGDPNITSYPAIGNGIYKSVNGGGTWTYLGLSETAITSKIIINPSNSNQIFVATMGLPFERNADRGLYRSDDGGASWQKILYLSDQAGVIDLVMNPSNPNELFASGWDRLRNNHESIVYGQHAKVYHTLDGGDSWTLLTNGLPQGIFSRTGLAICASQPNVVYALYIDTNFDVEGVYKSSDGGTSWVKTAGQGFNNPVGGFGWYFGQIRVDPVNPNLLYLLGVYTWRSTDGGAHWQRFTAYPGHPDKHDLIFNGNELLISTDGGLYRSLDQAESLIRIDSIPANQVYRVAYNPHHPYQYYCGVQDNGSSYGHAGALNQWQIYFGGDGFKTVFNPIDSNIFYAESQYGGIGRTIDGGITFSGFTAGVASSDRKNWDLPYLLSRFHPNMLYLGTHKAYRLDTTTNVFSAISGDLTDGNVYGDIFHNITTMDESFFVDGELYVGTSDANLWRKNNGNWVNISTGLPNRYVTSVKASPTQSGRIFVTHSGYRDNSFIPRVHRSDDFGASWIDISSNLPDLAVNDILVVPNRADSLLVVATDGGVYASDDAGAHWGRVGDNMPFVQVMHLAYNPVQNEIAAATFGRSVMTFPVDSLVAGETYSIVGQILTETGKSVPAKIRLTQPDGAVAYSESFNFEGLTPIGPYRLAPKLDTLPADGVNVLDLLMIYQHILGAPMDGTQLIAADADGDGDVDVPDLAMIRSLILGKITSLPNSQSWRFYADSMLYQLEVNDYGEGEAVRLDSLPVDTVRFLGVKVGDVNFSWGN